MQLISDDPAQPGVRRAWLEAVAIALLLSIVVLMSVSTIADDDVFWHLATGRWIWEHRQVPSTDVLSYTTEGMTLLPTEWGWELLTYLLVSTSGTLASLQILTALIWIAILALLIRLLRRFDVAPPVATLLLLITILVSVDRITPRPHLVSLLGMTFILSRYYMLRYIEKRGIGGMFVLPALFVLWANMHPGVVGGVIFLAILFLAECMRTWRGSRGTDGRDIAPLERPELWRFGLLVLACAAALLVNPNGWRTWEHLYNHPNLKLLATVIEWQSPFSPLVSSVSSWIFRVILILYAIAIYYSLRHKDPLPGFLYMGVGLYAIQGVRFQADFAIANVVGVAISVMYFSVRGATVIKRAIRGTAASLLTICMLLLIVILILTGSFYNILRYHNHFGFGLDPHYFSPGLMNFMKENRITGTPLNHFSIGGWLSWERSGEKTFIDSRDISERLADTYDSIMTMRPGFEEKLKTFGVDYVVIQLPDLPQNPGGMQATLIPHCSLRRDEWKLVYWDDYSFLYLKDTPRFQETIDQFEYRLLDPYLYSARHAAFDSLMQSDKPRFAYELKRKACEEPKGIILGFLARYAVHTLRQ